MKPVLLLSLALYTHAAENPKLPPPFHTPSATNGAKVVPQPAGKNLQVPEGFTVELFAEGLQKPRFLLALRSGAVLVSDSVAKGGIVALMPDKSKRTLLTNLDRPSAIAMHKGFLYVAEATAIQRYKFNAKSLTIGPAEKIIPLDNYGKGHWTRSLAFDKNGTLYVGVGSGSNVDAGDPPDRAVVSTYSLDGKNRQTVAGGIRNPVGIHIHPQSGKLWATVQERDGLGDDLVPDYFTEVKPGAFYGWPYAYIGPNEEPRRKGENPELVKKTIEPDVILAPHAAVMDFAFYTGKQFPAKYRNGAFLAYRGSSNRAKRLGYNVMFIPFQNGRPAGPPEEFLSGWMMGADAKEVWGRPVGVAQMSDGSLLVSEDGNNKIYRISKK
jgi:glucose/arabinose dehydrogenase